MGIDSEQTPGAGDPMAQNDQEVMPAEKNREWTKRLKEMTEDEFRAKLFPLAKHILEVLPALVDKYDKKLEYYKDKKDEEEIDYYGDRLHSAKYDLDNAKYYKNNIAEGYGKDNDVLCVEEKSWLTSDGVDYATNYVIKVEGEYGIDDIHLGAIEFGDLIELLDDSDKDTVELFIQKDLIGKAIESFKKRQELIEIEIQEAREKLEKHGIDSNDLLIFKQEIE